MSRLVSFALIVVGMVVWAVEGNRILRRYQLASRLAFGRRWTVRVDWLAVTGKDWLRLIALAMVALAVMMIGLEFGLNS
jgi:hypothetical protein